MKKRVDGDQRLVLFLASGPTHNGSVGQNNHAMRASVPTHPTEVRNHLVNIRVGNKPKMFAGDVHEWKGFELDLQPEMDIRDQLASKMCNVIPEHVRVLNRDRQLRAWQCRSAILSCATARVCLVLAGSSCSLGVRWRHTPRSLMLLHAATCLTCRESGPL